MMSCSFLVGLSWTGLRGMLDSGTGPFLLDGSPLWWERTHTHWGRSMDILEVSSANVQFNLPVPSSATHPPLPVQESPRSVVLNEVPILGVPAIPTAPMTRRRKFAKRVIHYTTTIFPPNLFFTNTRRFFWYVINDNFLDLSPGLGVVI